MKKQYLYSILFIISLYVPLAAQQKVDYKMLDEYIEKAVADFEMPGLSIAIVKDGKTAFIKSYGFKNAESKEKLNPESLFNIASCSKAFTAACIAILVNEGKLNWKDKIIDHIPEFKLSDPYITRELNLTDMLCHRSGFGTFYGDLLWYETDYDAMEIMDRLEEVPMTKDFRSEFGYQNNMYIIAGEVIKRSTGKSWEEFLKERILDPLEMHETRSCSKRLEKDQNIALPHYGEKTQEIRPYEPNPAASIWSNVSEIQSWMNMLLNEGKLGDKTILEPEVIKDLFTSHTILPVWPSQKEKGIHFNTYGLGWFLFDYGGKQVIEHDGGMPGYISKVTLVPEEEFGFVLLTNDMNILNGALRYKILDMLMGLPETDWAEKYLVYKKGGEAFEEQTKEKRLSKRIKGTTPSLELADYAGIYKDKMYGNAEVEIIDGTLKLTLLPAREVFVSKMNHWHFDTFQIKFKDDFLPDGYLTFELNADAEITGFKIDLPNPDFHFFNLDFRRTD